MGEEDPELDLSALARILGLLAVLLPIGLGGAVVLALAQAASTDDVAWAAARTALAGSLSLGALAVAIGLPLGVGAAVYLAEWPRSAARRALESALLHLAGLPSITMGALAAAIFAGRGLGRLGFALTLAALVLPVAALTTREALRKVPASVRRASIALGATRASMLWRVVLPAAAPGLLAGVCLSLARVLAETSALVAVGVLEPSGALAVPVLGAHAYRELVLRSEPAHAATALLFLFAPLALLHLAAALFDARLPRGEP